MWELMAYTILIVDDSKLARMYFAKILSALRPGWTRIEAANAAEAMGIIAGGQPHIAVLDFNMPGRDGLEMAGDMRRLYPNIPVAVISANIQVEVVARAKEAGAMFLPKPLTEAALGEFLKDAESRLVAAET
jgi:CheY-like chemotaxis protein